MRNTVCIDLLNGSIKKSRNILKEMSLYDNLYINSEDDIMNLDEIISVISKFTDCVNIKVKRIFINKLGMVVAWSFYNTTNKSETIYNNFIYEDLLVGLLPVDKVVSTIKVEKPVVESDNVNIESDNINVLSDKDRGVVLNRILDEIANSGIGSISFEDKRFLDTYV